MSSFWCYADGSCTLRQSKNLKTPIWDVYKKILNESEDQQIGIELIERFAFYERSKQAFAVVATGEGSLYGNIILKKGVLAPEE